MNDIEFKSNIYKLVDNIINKVKFTCRGFNEINIINVML